MTQTVLSFVPKTADAPTEEPLDRLQRAGAGALSDVELLALLLDTPQADCAELLEQHGGLRGIFHAGRQNLVNEPRILAAIELAVRFARARLPERLHLKHPQKVADYLGLHHARTDQEVMGALFLDVRSRLIADEILHVGTLSKLAVDPPTVLRRALHHCAARILVFHCHPSTDPSPSAEDLAFTRRLHQAAELLGLRLQDHIILGTGGRWASLQRCGVIP